MRPTPTQYLNFLREVTPKIACRELRKFGVYLTHRATREQRLQAVDALDPAIVERHLNKKDPFPVPPVVATNCFADNEPAILPLALRGLHKSLLQVHQNYLN
jgi:hypothetical protein